MSIVLACVEDSIAFAKKSLQFPRVVLHLDSENVVLSEELVNEVAKVKKEETPEALIALHHKFGKYLTRSIIHGIGHYGSIMV